MLYKISYMSDIATRCNLLNQPVEYYFTEEETKKTGLVYYLEYYEKFSGIHINIKKYLLKVTTDFFILNNINTTYKDANVMNHLTLEIIGYGNIDLNSVKSFHVLILSLFYVGVMRTQMKEILY